MGVLTSNVVIEGDMIISPNYTAVQEPAYATMEQWMVFGKTFYSRNFQPNTNDFSLGGHTICLDDAITNFEGIEFRHMGQGGRLARYPVHWHFRGNAPGKIFFKFID